MTQCNHMEITHHWVGEEDYYSGEMVYNWETRESYTTVDIDLHRYYCTQCEQVMYYSRAAKDYYEKGTPTEYITVTA